MESKLITTSDGDKYWYNEKVQLHRLDGSAAIFSVGLTVWCIEGKQHRINGPAAVWKNRRQANWIIRLSISYDPIMDNA